MFQTKLKMLREAAGYKSQQSFAKAFGVAQSTVGGWESGNREPDHETTKKLADFFNVPVDFLIEDECSPVVVDKDGKMLWAENPLSVLISQYHMSPDVLASISGTSLDTVSEWLNSSSSPSDEEYQQIADFFEIDIEEFKKGRIPFTTSKEVQLKVYGITDMRYAAYGLRSGFSKKDIDVIQKFLTKTLEEIEDTSAKE